METVDLIKGINDNVNGYQKQTEKEINEVKNIVEKSAKEVKELQDTITKQGATLLQISEETKELAAEKGRMLATKHAGESLISKIKAAIIEKAESFAKAESVKIAPIEFKHWGPDMGKVVGAIASANLTGDTFQSYLDSRPAMEPTGQIRFRDLVGTLPSATDYVQFARANTPVGEGSFGKQTEGSPKAQVDRDYTMIDVTLAAMAGYAIVSRQALRNIPFLQQWLPTSMLEQLLDAEDAEFSNLLVAAATGSSTTAGITATPERLIHFIKNLYTAKHNVTAFAVDPAVWAYLLTYRPGTDNPYSLPGVTAVDGAGNVRIAGRPVYPVNWLTGGRIIAGDWNKTKIIQSEGLVMRQSDSHASTFIANQLTFLLERTEGLAIFRPEAFITTTVTIS
jgi:HK97 family phage major capsid protein